MIPNGRRPPLPPLAASNRNNNGGDDQSGRRPSHLKSADRSPPLYRPSLYRYSCGGLLRLSSDELGREGRCYGIRSRLELLSDMELNTRQGAIQEFTSSLTDYDDLDESSSRSGPGQNPSSPSASSSSSSSLDQQADTLELSPALIYKSKNTNINQDTDEERTKLQLFEEDVIDRQVWMTVGSTEVEYLVLKEPHSGQEEIVAVAPRGATLAYRRIDTQQMRFHVWQGPFFGITMETSSETDRPPLPPTHLQQTDPNTERQELQDRMAVEEVPPRPPMDTLKEVKAAADKIYAFGRKTAEHMKGNAVWLYANVQDDFGQRTVISGRKILAQMPRTVDRTWEFARKMVRSWWEDEDDNDGPAHGPSR